MISEKASRVDTGMAGRTMARYQPLRFRSIGCGMAGSFGYEKEHYKTSLAIGEMILFPAVRKAVKESNGIPAIVAAPGTSCRQQILDGTGVKAVHPIEILYRFLNSNS